MISSQAFHFNRFPSIGDRRNWVRRTGLEDRGPPIFEVTINNEDNEWQLKQGWEGQGIGEKSRGIFPANTIKHIVLL